MNNNLFEQNGILLNDEALLKFEEFKELILEYNQIMDITNITEERQVYIKHFLDSLLLEKSSINFEKAKVIDIGTGGGFPGIPLKILINDIELTLLDSLKKRVNFLDIVIDKLELTKTKAIHGRAEEFAKKREYRELYDIATSRAVAELRTLIEYSLAYVKVGGYFIAMKGPNFQDELDKSTKAIQLMGGKLEKVIKYDLPDNLGSRSLIIIKKIKNTPIKYPRGQGKPRSKPL